ncbi:hypothetical protein [Novosphingobium terrae]|uniref:hypothetical protein n=1 Tax=Novosphingobium terrae TaxID=2726189 RepID=UPI00197EF74B|nr:hypothetical protein [Novosphingobium terrae]
MSYEHSSSSQNFTFPNPLREHKYFVAAAAVVSGLTGLVVLFQARAALHQSTHGRALGAALVAFALIVVAGRLLFQFFTQLRFFFGRGRPMGLAPQLAPDQLGTSPGAENYIKETLRQQALDYPEPRDPLSSLLYYLIPDLLYAPRPVRGFAERQFQSGILTLALLAGLLVIAVLGSGSTENAANVSSWVAIILFLASLPSLWKPKSGSPDTDAALSALSVPKMAGLIAFSVLGPVALSLLGSMLPPPPIGISTGTLFVLLLMTVVLHGLFFAAVIRHMMAAPSTTVTMIQDTWNISVTPALISAEFMRAMQEAWWEKIPNRRYCRIDPVVNLQQRSGQFHGSMVEETQPVPFVLGGKGAERPFASGNPVIINIINGYALFLTVMGAIGSYVLADSLIAGGRDIGSLLISTLFCWAVSKAAFDVARSLTLRFDFRSQLIWMEMSGTYNAAEVGQGNRYTSNLHSSSQVVQVEGMTFRLWVAEVHSVAFGKDGPRQIVSMLGEPDMAAALAARLRNFITSQATLISVGSAGDQERAAISSQMNANMYSGGSGPVQGNLPLS